MTAFDKSGNSDSVDCLMELISNMSEHEQENLLEELQERQGKEKRKYPRKPFLVSVDYADQENFYQDFIRDINANGVFIDTKKPFTVGKEVTLTFPIPHEQGQVKINGQIVRVTKQGIGVKFAITNEYISDMIKSEVENI